jgi:hypothetical protein
MICARKLVREVVDALLGGGNAGVLQQADGALAGFGVGHRQVRADGLDQLPTHGVERIQRGQRVLEDRADLAPANGPHRIEAEVVDALALQPDLAAGHAARRLEQADDGRARERLAGARLAHHAEDFSRRDVEGNPVERAQRASAVRKLDDEVFDLEQRHGGVLLVVFSAGAG